MNQASAASPEQNKISVYPDPASSLLHIRSCAFPDAHACIVVKNILGDALISKQGGRGNDIDVSSFPAGLYFLTVSFGNGIAVNTKFTLSK